MLPRSPPCLTGVFGPPWCAPELGLKCGPALVALGSLQSPFSWMCTPCSPGVAPCTSTCRATPPLAGEARAVPVTPLPLRASSVAVALPAVAARGAVACGEGDDEVAQAQTR